jgi:RNA polymerase sigma-70 factor (ECF subfamily)
MEQGDDLILVRKCLQGDNGAFAIILDKYQKIVFNLAFRMVNDFDDAEDITQSVFINVFEKLQSFNSKYRFFSWLYRIAVNESLNFLNQRKQFEELNSEIVSEEKTPEETYDEIETTRDVQKALMSLKPDYRIAVVLKHFQDLSYEEISHILDIPEKTVKSRLFTARQLLGRELLKKAM